jgi:hypothetical protein
MFSGLACISVLQFKRILNKELNQLAVSSKSGSEISEYISNTFLGEWLFVFTSNFDKKPSSEYFREAVDEFYSYCAENRLKNNNFDLRRKLILYIDH